MALTDRELWTAIHGMGLGALFLLAFAGGLVELYTLRPTWLSSAGIVGRVKRLNIGTPLMALAAWLTVITGTWIIYPWYRAQPPEGTAGAALQDYPRYYLLANENLADWHKFGMEWKEHIAWFAPILATAVAFVLWRYGYIVSKHPTMRRALITLFVLAFVMAGIAGLFGAFITKAAPIY